ncbi:MAG TPA: 3-dehydroquinate synthase [Candidatus Limnocylindrales bacterium]|nr:3-dehydroquinate synthase [Candidatus Limnocylindrales bacterium]
MNHVVLVGFMGSGKSTVGPLLAERLGRPFTDLDARIERESGAAVAEIFAREGEAGFRARESAALTRVMAEEPQVVAVGGGAPLADENWRRMREANVVVALLAEPQTLAGRLQGSLHRPLLREGVPAAIERLLPARLARYREADLVLDTDGRSAAAVASAIQDALPDGALHRVAVPVHGRGHEVVVGRRLQHLAGPALRHAGVQGTVVIASDASIAAQHAAPLKAAVEAAGLRTACYALPAGETAKTIGAVTDFYRFLAGAGVDRQGAILALGGGAVGDACGFVAATWLRGVPLLQVPTTLLAMVDSSIGGKNGINLEDGKNLVGTIHQPCGILDDITHLATLPDRAYRASWAEVIKSAIIADTNLFDVLARGASPARSRDGEYLGRVIAATCAIKARVVAADPFEAGERAILNYGHTVGHALEAALGYGSLAHGEAVAWGMQVAADLSWRSGRCPESVVRAQEQMLRDYGLLDRPPRVDPARVFAAMRHDKKAQDGEVRWVLLTGIGHAEYGCRVPFEDVERSVAAVLA